MDLRLEAPRTGHSPQCHGLHACGAWGCRRAWGGWRRQVAGPDVHRSPEDCGQEDDFHE